MLILTEVHLLRMPQQLNKFKYRPPESFSGGHFKTLNYEKANKSCA